MYQSQEMSQILQINQNFELWQHYQHSPVLHNIPGASEFIATVLQDSHKEKLVAVGGPPGAGKETFIGQVLHEIEDARGHPENYSFTIPQNLEVKHLSYAEALREARRKGLITSLPDHTNPVEDRHAVSKLIDELIENFYADNNDNHPKLLFYEAVMVTYPEEDIGALPLRNQQRLENKARARMQLNGSVGIANLGPRRVFTALLAPDLELIENVSRSLRNDLQNANDVTEIKGLFETYGSRFDADAIDQTTLDTLNTSWAGPKKFDHILQLIKTLMTQQKNQFRGVLPVVNDEIEAFLNQIDEPIVNNVKDFDKLFAENPEYFIFAQLALYFIFAIAEMQIPDTIDNRQNNNLFIGVNRSLEPDSEGKHLNPYYRRLVEQHSLLATP